MTAIVLHSDAHPIRRWIDAILAWIGGGRETLPATQEPGPAGADELTAMAISRATGRLMWAQRGALTIEVNAPAHDAEGYHAPTERTHTVTIPGGIVFRMGERADHATLTSPDGQIEMLQGEDMVPVRNAWWNIQAVAIAEELGVELPADIKAEGNTLRGVLARHIGELMSRVQLQAADGRYTHIYHVKQGKDDYRRQEQEQRSAWRDLGGDVLMAGPSGGDRYYQRDERPSTIVRLLHPVYGVLRIPGNPVEDGIEAYKRSSFATALGLAQALPEHIPIPRGNAQAARILRLCREAVAAEPDLATADGTPIAPLVNRHLPELMRTHAAAAATAPADQLAQIDADLMAGIERVRLALDESLRVSANTRRDAFRTQLAFLEMRHPEAREGIGID